MNTDSLQKKENTIRLMKCLHIIFTLAAFFVAWLIFRYGGIGKANFHVRGFRYNYLTLALFFSLLFFFIKTYNAYLLGYCRIRNLVVSQFIAQGFSVALIYLCTSVAWM